MERIGHYAQLPDGWCYSTIKEVFIINPRNKVDDDVEVGFVQNLWELYGIKA